MRMLWCGQVHTGLARISVAASRPAPKRRRRFQTVRQPLLIFGTLATWQPTHKKHRSPPIPDRAATINHFFFLGGNVGNLAIWQLRNLATWQFGNLAIYFEMLGNLEMLQPVVFVWNASVPRITTTWQFGHVEKLGDLRVLVCEASQSALRFLIRQ